MVMAMAMAMALVQNLVCSRQSIDGIVGAFFLRTIQGIARPSTRQTVPAAPRPNRGQPLTPRLGMKRQAKHSHVMSTQQRDAQKVGPGGSSHALPPSFLFLCSIISHCVHLLKPKSGTYLETLRIVVETKLSASHDLLMTTLITTLLNMVRLSPALLAVTAFFPSLISADPKVLGFDFYKGMVDARDVPSRLVRRQNVVNADLTNEVLLYFINVTVGTPGQPFSLQLDTGSSDIWFPSANSDVCASFEEGCAFGSYNSAASSTYANPNLPMFEIQYVDGSQISGDYISDVLNIGSTKLTQMTMAEATQATRGIGIMGVGYRSGESSAELDGFTYPNVVNVLKNEGYISSLAYSLYLNDLEANTGSILFGGVDTDKFTGDLIALPVQLDSQTDSLTSFTVAWTGLTVTGGGKTSNLSPSAPVAAILDCGTTDLYVPDDIATAIFNGVGVITDPTYGNVVKCSLANDDLTFSFQFGGANGPTINVALSEFVTPIPTANGLAPTFDDGSAACAFAIGAAGSDPILFGDTFLRSAYVVYDIETNIIALAQTNFDHLGSSNVKEISGGQIPGVSLTASSVTVQQTASNPFINPAATSEAAIATGILGTSRSATFVLTPATGGATTTGRGASGIVRAPTVQGTTILAGLVVLGGLLFGGGLMMWM
jgi:Eukaryotic aspartyl protease